VEIPADLLGRIRELVGPGLRVTLRHRETGSPQNLSSAKHAARIVSYSQFHLSSVWVNINGEQGDDVTNKRAGGPAIRTSV